MRLIITLFILSYSTICFSQSTIYYTDNGEITIKEIASFYRKVEIDTNEYKFKNIAKEFDSNSNKLRTIHYNDYGQFEKVILYNSNDSIVLSFSKSNGWHILYGDAENYSKNELKELYIKLDNRLANQSEFKTSIFIRLNEYPELRKKIIPKSSYDPNSNDFQIVEEAPHFPGGMQTLGQFLSLFLEYPSEAKKKNITGVVKVQFKVNPDGTASNYKIIQSVGYGCDKEAIRVLKLLPDWVPGYQRGKAVETILSLPITFN